MAYTTINKSTDYFNTKLWTGTGADNNVITNVGFQPDWVWSKNRDGGGASKEHLLIDAVRGLSKRLCSNNSNEEGTLSPANAISSFDSNGYTLGSNSRINGDNLSYVGWNWKANGAGSANTAGSINSTVSVNQTAGFSIVSYTSTGSNATVGHGLGVAPAMIIFKRRSGDTENWPVYHQSLGNTKSVILNGTDAQATSSARFQDTSPTSTVFSVGTSGDVNGGSSPFIAYCFAEKTGYSKFGSYTGTSSQVFIYTGFKPKFILIKKTSEAASWHLFDTSRTVSNGGNQLNKILFPNLSNAESDDAYNYVDAVSNGFRCFSGPSGQGTETNKNGQTFIYMAIGQSIVGSNNIPATAR